MIKFSHLLLVSISLNLANLSMPQSFAASHRYQHNNTNNLPQLPPTMAHQLNQTPTKKLTPAQQVALPDGGAPPPPHGYMQVEDSEEKISNFSAAVRTHLPVGLPGTKAQQNTNQPNNLPSHFSIFGMPVKFNAPVAPPYQSEDTPESYAGRNGQTNILIQGDSSLIH